MTAAKNILRIVPTVMAAKVATNAYRNYSSKKKRSVKSIVKHTTGTLVGVSLISPTASIIEGMS